MPQILRKKILARELDQAFTNTQVEVEWTATMANGSCLVAAGTEAAAANAADVQFIINDYGLDALTEPSVGDDVQVNVITFGAKVYWADLKFSDRALAVGDITALTAMTAKQVELV